MKKLITQIRRLTELFFIRFFRNDSMPFENESEANIIVILSIICMLGFFFTYNMLLHYIFTPENGNSWNEKSQIILIFMLMIGFITLLEWEVLLPDKNDYIVLTPLPVNPNIIFISKFLSFILFVALFAFSANLLSAFFFPVFLSAFYKGGTAFYFIYFFFVHLLVAFSANIFVFFVLLSLKGILMIFLPMRIYRKISSIMQGGLMIIMLSIYAFIPKMCSILFELMKKGDKRVLYYPQMWFTGLYEYLLGRRTPVYAKLSSFALYSLLASFILAIIVFSFSYAKHAKNAGEVLNRKKINKQPIYSFFRKIFNFMFLKDQTEKAVFYFMNKTLKRSGKHRVKLFGFMAAAIAIIVSKFVTEQRTMEYIKQLGEWHKVIYSLPFIIWFFLIIGLRAVSNHPVSPSSNWIFRLTENKDKRPYRRGVHKTIILSNIIPIFLILLLFYSFIFGFEKALIFNLYSLFIGFLMEEILFFNIKIIPYTCVSLPGKGNLKLFFIVYLLIFLLYVSVTGYFGYWIIEVPSLFKNFVLVAVISLFVLFFIKKIFEKPNFDLVFEEEEEEVMLSFHPVKY